jgi:hypothetical protein
VNIVRAEVDGRTFYRVRIPMASRDEAVNLCTRYQSGRRQLLRLALTG